MVRWEKSTGLSLPDAYRRFMLAFNGGRVYPRLFRYTVPLEFYPSTEPVTYVDPFYPWAGAERYWRGDIYEILSANSEGWRQRSKAGHARLGARPSVQPVYDPQDVHRSRRTHLLEAGLQEPDIPAPPHSKYPHTL